MKYMYILLIGLLFTLPAHAVSVNIHIPTIYNGRDVTLHVDDKEACIIAAGEFRVRSDMYTVEYTCFADSGKIIAYGECKAGKTLVGPKNVLDPVYVIGNDCTNELE